MTIKRGKQLRCPTWAVESPKSGRALFSCKPKRLKAAILMESQDHHLHPLMMSKVNKKSQLVQIFRTSLNRLITSSQALYPLTSNL